MKNILSEKPVSDLHGRLKFSTKLVSKKDISNKIILDIGCGYGWFEIHALSQNPTRIVGTEISANDLKTIRMNLHDSRLKAVKASGEKLPFKNNSFDTVVSWEVLEHVPPGKDLSMFREVSRVLKRNGVFYMSTPYASFWSKIFDPAWYLLGHRHYSIEKISSLAEDSGMQISETYVKGRFWEIVQSLDLYISKWVFRRKMIFMDLLKLKIDEEYKFNGVIDLFVKLKKC